MLIYDDFSKKYHVIFKKFFLLFLNFLSYLVCVPSFMSINSSSLSRKKYDGDNFTPTPRQNTQGKNTSVGIWLIEFTQPSDTLKYKLFFKHCILQTLFFYTYFFCLYLCGTKSFVLKSKLYFTFFLIWFGLAFGVTVLKVLCFIRL